MMRIVSVLVAFLLLLNGCASSKKEKQIEINGIAQDQWTSGTSEEMNIGRRIHSTILSSFYAYTDPRVVDYVNRIGRSLAEQAPRKDLPYSFTVLYNEKIYATSAPGGYIYLTTGLMYFLDNEAELAAVIAHEIGELQYRDPRPSKAKKILEGVTAGAAVVGPAFGEIGVLAVLGLALLNKAAEHNPLTAEEKLRRADAEAIQYMVKAGYDPQGMIDFLYKFLNNPRTTAGYLDDYSQARPVTQDRFEKVQKEFLKLPLADKSFSANRKAYQEMIKGIGQMYHT